MINKLRIAFGLSLALVVAGCSGDPGEEVEAEDPASQPSQARPADGNDASSDMGSVTVNGDVYAVNSLNNCEDDDAEVLDLQAFITGGGKINLNGRGEVVRIVSMDGRALEENYGSSVFGDAVIHESSITGDRVTGSATLEDIEGSGSTIDIEWDVQIPSEARDCSL